MFSSIEGFGNQLFVSLVMIIVIIITSHIASRPGRLKFIEIFTMLVSLLVVGTQYYFLVKACVYLPTTKHWLYNPSLQTESCLKSAKGGKRPDGSFEHFDLNPCFCFGANARCVSKSTGEIISSPCPTDGSANCFDGNGKKIDLYLNAERNCEGGVSNKCTQERPCFPCELGQVMAFNSTRCRTCSTDFSGDCKFVEGVGPYCFDSVGSRRVVPCKKCCSEPQLKFLSDGTCV